MADGQTRILSQKAAAARATYPQAKWYSNLAKQGLSAAQKMAQWNANRTPFGLYERMSKQERLLDELNFYRAEQANLDPGDFVGRWISGNKINRVIDKLAAASGEKDYSPMGTIGLGLPNWVKDLGLVAQTAQDKGITWGTPWIPQTLAPLGAQATLTPSQQAGLMGLVALAGEEPTTQKIGKRPTIPSWEQYQNIVTNYLPSWWQYYQALSQKLFPKTYGVRPRWATALQR